MQTPKPSKPGSGTITFKLPPPLRRRLRVEAAKRDMTLSALVRELLEAALRSERA